MLLAYLPTTYATEHMSHGQCPFLGFQNVTAFGVHQISLLVDMSIEYE